MGVNTLFWFDMYLVYLQAMPWYWYKHHKNELCSVCWLMNYKRILKSFKLQTNLEQDNRKYFWSLQAIIDFTGKKNIGWEWLANLMEIASEKTKKFSLSVKTCSLTIMSFYTHETSLNKCHHAINSNHPQL